MIPKHGAKTRLVLIAMLAILAAVEGCSRQAGVSTQQLPHDPLARTPVQVPETSAHGQGEMAGEVTRDSVILQARMTKNGKVVRSGVTGCSGIGTFALSTDAELRNAFRLRWMAASPAGDYVIKTKVGGLEAGTRYYYRFLSGPDVDSVEAGPTGTFRTLDPHGVSRPVRLVVVTGMNQFAFQAEKLRDLAFRDLSLGFPGLATIVAHQPDFFIGTGDTVYYDCPFVRRAYTMEGMRAKWQRQFATPRFASLFLNVPTYWEKDDHDYRYEDSDPHGPFAPSPELGTDVFLEQVPVVDPDDESPVTYRTHRINDLLQIWLLEGRDHRDANIAPPGPDKTMWGAEQREWLQQTLLESDAAFKVLISPTPMVGPDDTAKGIQGGLLAPYFGGRPLGQGDDKRKRDNHLNELGFKDEGDAFFDWLGDEGFLHKNLYIVCGDRHWQYHSVHPAGFEEFSVGALVDGSARLGPRPGDDTSTDPDGQILQPYAQDEASGGFLELTVRPASGATPATAEFAFYDEQGALLYRAERASGP